MIKNYILDTNVILHDPECFLSFDDNNIFIPLPVIEELDKFKTFNGELGFNSRKAIRFLDNLRDAGNISEGVPIVSGGNLKVLLYNKSDITIPDFLDTSIKDNIILLYVKKLNENSNLETIFVTKDKHFRVKCEVMGLRAVDYENDKVYEEYNGWISAKSNKNIIENLMSINGKVNFTDAKINGIHLNEYIKYPNNLIGKFCGDIIQRVDTQKIYGINPLNVEQIMLVDALMDENISMVTAKGIAGTGKTLLSLAAAFEQRYERILYLKPIVSVGNDIGFLPGSKEEKLLSWYKPLYDNLMYLQETNYKDDLIERIEVDAVTYMRGRNLNNCFIILDECQNLTKRDVKTIVTRVGAGSKIVVCGDIEQIDHPYLTKEDCGLTHVIESFKEEATHAHITLIKSERSELAELAAKLL